MIAGIREDEVTQMVARTTWDPLQKYTEGIMPKVHLAHPAAALNDMDLECIQEWDEWPKEKLLMQPFGTMVFDCANHNTICSLILGAVGEITKANNFTVYAPQLEDNNTKVLISFLIYDLTAQQKQSLLTCHIWSSPQITFHVLNFEPECPDFLFTIKGLSTLREQEVFAVILDTWHDNETNSFLLSICEQAGNPEVAIMHEMLMDFTDAVWMAKIDTRERGNILAPSFRVFTPGALIPNACTWCHLRKYLASRSYSIQHQSPGTSIKPSKMCTICHGTNHPRGLCPFLNVTGWNGPLH